MKIRLNASLWVSFAIASLCFVSLGAKTFAEARLKLANNQKIALEPIQAGYQGDSLKKTSLGFDNFIASLLWIRMLQVARHDKAPAGKVTWEYAQADAITTLDPKFQRGYSYGAIFLSVFRRDALGAKLLLEKWIRRFPLNWRAHYMLAYHLAFEMDNPKDAAGEMIKAGQLEGAPPFIGSLGLRLLSQNGLLTQALQVAVDLYNQSSSEEARELVTKRIRSIRFALQKADLESALEIFRKKFGKNPNFELDLIPFTSTQARDVAMLKNVDESRPELASLLEEKFPIRYNPTNHSVYSAKTMDELGIDIVGSHWKEGQ